jgi:hypothetical protein
LIIWCVWRAVAPGSNIVATIVSFSAGDHRRDAPPHRRELGGEIGNIVLLPAFTTAAFVKIARERMAAGAAKASARRYNPH